MLNFLVIVSSIVSAARAATYSLSESNVGADFLTNFGHQAIADPTHGRVNYLDEQSALSQNLTFASDDAFIMRADDTTVLSASGPGRNSVRIQSNAQYTTHVVVADVRHMPQGCATWPALWETGDDWPNNGEVDILEGVNDVEPNQSTLHTSAGCGIPATSPQKGLTVSTDCNVADDSNTGCGVKADTPTSFGPGFNDAGGGWYTMERTSDFIKVWFWLRSDPTVPSDVSSGAGAVDTDNWGTPTVFFPNTDCNLASHFGPNNIVVDLTLCGDWAGNSYTSDGCGSDCTSFVNENPGAFTNAFWDFAGLRVYE